MNASNAELANRPDMRNYPPAGHVFAGIVNVLRGRTVVNIWQLMALIIISILD